MQEEVEFVRGVTSVESALLLVRLPFPGREELELAERRVLVERLHQREKFTDGLVTLRARGRLAGRDVDVAEVARREGRRLAEQLHAVERLPVGHEHEDVLRGKPRLSGLREVNRRPAVRVRPHVGHHGGRLRQEVAAREIACGIGVERKAPRGLWIGAGRRHVSLHRRSPIRPVAERDVLSRSLRRAPRREEERRTEQHVPDAHGLVAAVEHVAELVAEIAPRHVFRGASTPCADGNVMLRAQSDESPVDRETFAHTHGHHVDPRAGRRVREAHGERAARVEGGRFDAHQAGIARIGE